MLVGLHILDEPKILAIPLRDDLKVWQIFRTTYQKHYRFLPYDLKRLVNVWKKRSIMSR